MPDALLESGRAWLGVSHREQERQLLAAHPKSAGRTLLVGDPCFDEITAARNRRDHHRRALLPSADGNVRLVVLSSTWGPNSLFGRDPGLPARLLARLPYETHRVALILHPNVWSAHGAWQLRSWLAPALGAGLLLVPPVHEWRATVAAADVLVGDHGSVALYGAAADVPVLLAAFGDEVVPGTAAHDLAGTAPRLDARGDLTAQIDAAVSRHTPGRHDAVARRAFEEQGSSASRLRTELYRLLRLPEPPTQPPVARQLDPPKVTARPVSSWQVTTTVATRGPERASGVPAALTVHRFPAAVASEPAPPTARPGVSWATHLASTEGEADPRLVESASVILRENPAPTHVSARQWAHEALERYPGCLLTATVQPGGTCLIALRDGRTIEAALTGPRPEPGLAAASVYACLLARLPLHNALLTLNTATPRRLTTPEDLTLRVLAATPDRV